MTLMTNRYYDTIKDYLYPNVHTFVDHYRNGDLTDLPFYHRYDRVSRNGTRKLLNIEMARNVSVQLINLSGK